MGAGHTRKTNHVVRVLGIWATWYQPNFLSGEQGARESVQSILCVWHPPKNRGHPKLGGVSWLVNASMCWEGGTSWFHREGGVESLWLGPSQTSPMCLFIWLVLIYILCNETVIKYSPCLSFINPSKLWNLRGSWEPLNLWPIGWKWGWAGVWV